ncbi:MAG: radical SAM protein, partial [Acidimicrobiales bacterium]
GSDRVLSAMRRGYRVERYQRLLAAARAAIPDLAVTTDLIVGFPGESDAEFDETLAVVAACDFDSAYTFIFSPREGTRAAGMTASFVDPARIQERFVRLKEVVDRSALRRHEARVGRLEEVLVEGPSRRDEAVRSGRTRQGKLIHLPDPTLRAGALVEARVTHGAPHFLLGEVVRPLRPPRHKIRVPLAVS